ncbi:hypothetical protein BC828DRAFT_372128 [Blastocladiella britannica]|nr:hypothetical protein BC828DRAFT_372128 [Blastocladiella britannica]
MNMMRAGMTAAAGCASAAAMVVKAMVDPFGLSNSSHEWWPVILATAAVGFVVGAAVAKWQTDRCLATTVSAWRQMLTDAAVLVVVPDNAAAKLPPTTKRRSYTEPTITSKPIVASATCIDSESNTGTTRLAVSPSSVLGGGGVGGARSLAPQAAAAATPLAAITLPTLIASLTKAQTASDTGSGSESLSPRRRAGSRADSLSTPMANFQHLAKQQQGDGENVVLAKLTRGGSSELLGAFKHREPKRRTSVFDSAHQVEICLRFVRDNPTAQQLTLGLQLLERGIVEFPKDPLLMLLSSTYLAAYYGGDGETAADQLMRGLYLMRGGVPLDVKFLAFSRDRAVRARGTHVLDRAAIESMEREVRVHHLRALYLVRDIWELVRISSTSTRLALAVTQLAVHMTGATAAYARLLERNPRDKRLLRIYSQYLLLVEADTVRAMQVLDIAEDVEVQEARIRRTDGVVPGNAVSADIQVAVSHISDDDGDQQGARAARRADGAAVAMGGDGLRADAAIMLLPDASTIPPPLQEDFPDSRHILWKNSKRHQALQSPSQQTSQQPSFSSLPPDVITIQARTGRGGSQTSGTSMSRAERQRISMRRVLNERVARPLNSVRTMSALSGAFLLTVVVGFAVCMQMFSATIGVLNVQFVTARNTRRYVLTVMENIRQVLFTGLAVDQAGFAANVAAIKTTLVELSGTLLPTLANMWNSLPTAPPLFRMYKAKVDGGVVSYQAFAMDALQVSQAVVQAGQSALVYSGIGQLTPEIANSTPEIRFLTDNIETIITATRTLTQTAIDAYNQMVTQNMIILLSSLVAAILCLVATYTFTYRSTLQSYFVGETQILKLVLSVPKKLASALVLSMEEEIESFKELVDSENDLMSDIDFKTLPSSENRGKDVRHRGKRFAAQILVGFAVVAAFSVGMFAQALSSLDLNKGFSRLMANADRRLNVIASRTFANEWASVLTTISNDQCSKVIQGVILEMTTSNNVLFNDPGGLQAQFPALTTQPRDCVTSVCASVVAQPAVGYTLGMASLPLNAELARYQDVLSRLGSYVSNFTTATPGPPANTYLLLKALVADLDSRLGALTAAIMVQFVGQINAASTTTVILFVSVMALFVCGVAAFVGLILNRLRREAHAVTTLLYMIPPAAQKEVVGLDAFLETGGVLLRAHVSSDDQ